MQQPWVPPRFVTRLVAGEVVFPEELEWLGPLLARVNRSPEVRKWVLGFLVMAFGLSYAVVFIAFFQIHGNFEHMVPYVVLAALSGPTGALFLYLAHREMGGDRHRRERAAWQTPDVTPRIHTPHPTTREYLTPSHKRLAKLDYAKLLVVCLVVLLHVFDITDCEHFLTRKKPVVVGVFQHFVTPWLMPLVVFCSGLMDTGHLTLRRPVAVAQLLLGYGFMQYALLILMKETEVTTMRAGNLSKMPEELMCFSLGSYVVPPKPRPPGALPIPPPQDLLPFWRVLQMGPQPFYHLWFLAALAAWRMVSPMWMRLRYPIVAAVLLSVLTGFMFSGVEGQAIFRILGYLPFYIAGVSMRQHGYVQALLDLTAHRDVKVWAWMVLSLCGLVAVGAERHNLCLIYFDRSTALRIVQCSSGLPQAMGWQVPDFNNYMIGGWALLFGQVVSFVAGLAVLCVLPDGEYPILQKAGSMTLVTYLFHPIPLFLLHTYTTLMSDYTAGHIIPVMFVAAAATFTLFIPEVNRALSTLVAPPVTSMGIIKEE